jgi:sulfur carrier protein
MEISVNSEVLFVEPGTMLGQLVERLGFSGKPLAIERNEQLVPSGVLGETPLQAGDRLEIVTLVGGG